jgi:hypothetical protein
MVLPHMGLTTWDIGEGGGGGGPVRQLLTLLCKHYFEAFKEGF